MKYGYAVAILLNFIALSLVAYFGSRDTKPPVETKIEITFEVAKPEPPAVEKKAKVTPPPAPMAVAKTEQTKASEKTPAPELAAAIPKPHDLGDDHPTTQPNRAESKAVGQHTASINSGDYQILKS